MSKFPTSPSRAAIFKPTRKAGRSFSAFAKLASETGTKVAPLIVWETEDELLDWFLLKCFSCTFPSKKVIPYSICSKKWLKMRDNELFESGNFLNLKNVQESRSTFRRKPAPWTLSAKSVDLNWIWIRLKCRAVRKWSVTFFYFQANFLH